MAINKKLIHFKNLTAFETQKAAGNILDTSICFIQDAKKIYTHGQFYDCSAPTMDLSQYLTESEIQELLNGYATTAQLITKQDKISDLATIRENAASALQVESDPIFKASAAYGIKPDDITNWNSKTSNVGTITGIRMNGTDKGSNGIVDLGTVITAHQDISGKLDATTAASTYLSKDDAASTYLGKTAKAASATKADQDGNGNIIVDTYSVIGHIHDVATSEKNGFISKGDKIKLDGIEAGAQVNTITGVKGGNESSYRTGNVNITKVNIGLGNVDNTSDAAKPISTATQNALNKKQDAIEGMGLSSNDYTTAEKEKLASITAGAEINVQADWAETNSTVDSYIKNKPTFAKVATTGSYNDLDNKPSIPSAVTESTVSEWGFTKNTGTYSKPGTGIPSGDLSEDVQALLAKAGTALQSYTEKYTGTYSKPSGGIPKSDLASAVQTSLGKADTALQSFTESDPIFTASVAYGISADDIANWNNKVSPISGKGLSTNDFTTILKDKLDGIASGAEVNQNAFAKVTVGSTTITADAKQDTLTLVAGSNVTITPDATNDKITINATDTNTTYTFASGTNQFTVTPSGGSAQTVTVTPSIAVASTSANGLMSKDDKAKLDGLSNYNDASVKSSITTLQNQLNTLIGGGSTEAIDSFNEITAFLENIEDSNTLEGIIGGINTEIAAKADKADVIASITRSSNTFTAKNAAGESLFTFTQKDSNTTYTFEGGTNQFTVTPSGGTAQTVTITPSISKNVTYTGTLVGEQIAIFDGTTGAIKSSDFTIGTSVPANAKFTDTTYSSKAAASGGTAVSLVTTGEKYTWNQAATAVATKVTGDGITTLKKMAQADYTALSSKSDNTLYIIV